MDGSASPNFPQSSTNPVMKPLEGTEGNRRLVNSVILRGPPGKVINVQETVVEESTTQVRENQIGEYPLTRKVLVQETYDKRYIVPSDDSEWTDKTASDDTELNAAVEGIHRRIPLPVEQVTALEFWLPKMRVEYESVEIPLYIPKFIEVPYPADMIDDKTADYANHFKKHIDNFAEADHASLCEVENVAAAVTASDFSKLLASSNIPTAAENAWLSGKLKINHQSYEKILAEPFSAPPVAHAPPKTH